MSVAAQRAAARMEGVWPPPPLEYRRTLIALLQADGVEGARLPSRGAAGDVDERLPAGAVGGRPAVPAVSPTARVLPASADCLGSGVARDREVAEPTGAGVPGSGLDDD